MICAFDGTLRKDGGSVIDRCEDREHALESMDA